jgi:hypothetical protein
LRLIQADERVVLGDVSEVLREVVQGGCVALERFDQGGYAPAPAPGVEAAAEGAEAVGDLEPGVSGAAAVWGAKEDLVCEGMISFCYRTAVSV